MGSGEYPTVLLHLIGAEQLRSQRELVGRLRSPPGAFPNPGGNVEHVFRSRRDSEVHFTRRLACGERPPRSSGCECSRWGPEPCHPTVPWREIDESSGRQERLNPSQTVRNQRSLVSIALEAGDLLTAAVSAMTTIEYSGTPNGDLPRG